MKGSNRGNMKEEPGSAVKPRISTRSTGQATNTTTRSLRALKSSSSTSSPSMVSPRRLRSLSPGIKDGKVRPKRAKVEKEQDTPRASKSTETTPKNGSQPIPVPETSDQSIQMTPKGAGIRTRLSTGSIHMNGTMTISAAKEKAEMDQIIKQIAKTEPGLVTKTPPSSQRKRQTTNAPCESVPVDHPPPKKRKIGRNDGSGEDNCNDYFCWLCHKEGTLVCCELCPRVYHTRCLGLSAELPQDWVCPECEKIMRAECVDTRSKAMEMLTIEQLCTLLKYSLERMKHAGSEPFQKPVDVSAVPNYSDYIFHPMDLTTLEKNIKKKMYGCTEALLADAKWILHNCIIYNGAHHKLTNSAKMIIKICKHEMNEIELCPDCYLNSCVRKDDEWFSDTCRVPHTLVWAKLKGYPFWPSKALREVDGQVDVRFFGAHDRSWVPVSQCFLLSKNIPTSLQKGKKNNGLDMAIEELNLHVKKLREKFGGFEYAPFRTPYDKTDSYKPVTIKPEVPSKPNTAIRLTQNKESKINNSSSFTGSKPNILRKSVAKIRNKYSAIVTLKKMDLSPEKGKNKKPVIEGQSVMKDSVVCGDNVKVELKDIGKQTAVSGNKVVEAGNKVVEVGNKVVEAGNKVVEAYLSTCEDKDKKPELDSSIKGSEDKGKEKGIKKTFVSSSLIRQIEDKLKGLVEEEGKEDVTADKVVEDSAQEISDTAKIADKVKEPDEKLTEAIEKTNDFEDNAENCEGNVEEGKVESKEGDISSSDSTTEVEKQSEKISPTKSAGNENKQMEINQTEAESEKLDAPKVGTSSTDTESKDSYRMKLDTMIKSCKEKLGMDKEKLLDNDSVISENGDEDDDDENDDSSDEDDDDDNVYSVESDDNSDESESEETSEEGKEKSEMDSSNTDATKVSDNEKDSEDKSGNSLKKQLDKVEETPVTTSSEISEKQSTETSESKKAMDNLKSDTKTVENKELDNEDTNKDRSNITEDLKPDDEIKEKSDNSERKSVNPDNSASSVSQESSENLDATKVDNDKAKTIDEKSLASQAGESKDRITGCDEESDTDRLVIDLGEESDKNQSITKSDKEESKKLASATSPTSKVIDVENDSTKVKETSTKKSLVKDPETEGEIDSSKLITKSKDDVDCVRFDAKDKQQGEIQSSKKKDMSKSDDLVEKDNCSKTSDKTKASDLPKRRKSQSLERQQSKSPANETGSKTPDSKTASKSPVNRTQSKSPVNRTQSKSPVNRTQSKSPANLAQSKSPLEDEIGNRTQSNECMDIDDDDNEGHEDFSADIYSNIPSNLDSSIPDKNFVKPPQVDDIDELPTSSKIAEKFSKKLLEKIQQTVDEMCSEVIKEKNDSKTVEILNQKLKQAQWNYYAELNELKHNFQLTMYEMKSGWESEKEQITKSLTAKFQAEKELAVREAKKKQWCAQCGKEAIFYCCWNTSYCDYPCQQSHWPQHMHTCLQTNKDKTPSTKSNTSTNSGQKGQGQSVSQTSASVPASATINVAPQTSVSAANQSSEPDHLRRLQDNLTMALQREEEKRAEGRPGVSPKFNSPMSSPIMQNIRQPGPPTGGMMFNMQQPMPPNMMQQIQRNRFPNQQQMAMQVQQRSSLPQSQQQQQGNQRMLFSQPLIQQTIYPLQVQPQQQLAQQQLTQQQLTQQQLTQQQLTQQQLGGTLLFQNPQPNLMTYGMPPRPY